MEKDTRANLAFLGMNAMFAIGALFTTPIIVFPFLLLMVLHGGLAISHTRLDQKKTPELPAKTMYHCEVYETRKLELGLAEAGIMQAVDVATCEDKSCPYCVSTHKAIESKKSVEAEMFARERRRAAARRMDAEWERNKSKNKRQRDEYYQRGRENNYWAKCGYCGYYSYVYNDNGLCTRCNNSDFIRNRARPKDDIFCMACGEYDRKPHVHYYRSDLKRGRIGSRNLGYK